MERESAVPYLVGDHVKIPDFAPEMVGHWLHCRANSEPGEPRNNARPYVNQHDQLGMSLLFYGGIGTGIPVIWVCPQGMKSDPVPIEIRGYDPTGHETHIHLS